MYINANYYSLVAAGGAFSVSGTLGSYSITDDDIMLDSFQIDEALNTEGGLQIGGIITSQLKLTLNNYDSKFDPDDLTEASELDLVLTIGTESLTLPTYHIVDKVVGTNTITLTCLDLTDLLHEQVLNTISGSKYLDYATNICTAFGLSIAYDTAAYNRLNVTAPALAYDGATYKSILSNITQACNCFARISSGNTLRFFFPDPTATPNPVTADMVASLDIEGPHTPTFIAIKGYLASDYTASGTPGYNLTSSGNPLITEPSTAAYLTAFSALSFYNFDLDAIGDPSVQVGDYILIGGSQKCLVGRKCFKLGGYMKLGFKWDIDETLDFSYALDTETAEAITVEINEAIDDLEIGGRNLVLRSDFEDYTPASGSVWTNNGDGSITAYSAATGNTTANLVRVLRYLSDYGKGIVANGTKLTITAEYKIDTALSFGSTSPWVGMQFSVNYSGGTEYISWYGGRTIPTAVTDGWVKHSQTYTVTHDPTSVSNPFIYFRDVSGQISFRNIKVEIGDKATDWMPAPEDVVEDGGKTATEYITYIDSTDGIHVHNSDDLTDYVQINSGAVSIYRDGVEVTRIEDAKIVLGDPTGTHTEISAGSYDIIEAAMILAHFGYGPGTNDQGGTSDAPYYTLGARSSQSVGNYSVAEGYNTEASGYSSHAEGDSSKANGFLSHAEGYGTEAKGMEAHAEGYNTKALGPSSHAEGSNSKASGYDSHAEGMNTTAGGNYSHAEGMSTTASGDYSHAEGMSTTASGDYSHAQNLNTNATVDCQTAIGKFNATDSGAFIIGNGTAANRKNCFVVDWDGFITHQTGKPLPTLSFGTCDTAAATAAKEILLAADMNFTLTHGSIIGVAFTNTNTGTDPTFTIKQNGAAITGAISLKYAATAPYSSGNWVAGQADYVNYYMYDGTYWVFMTQSQDRNTTYTNAALGHGYGTNTQAATVTARTATISNYTLTLGGIVAIHFSNAVPANATLNIRTRGAKPIFYHGAAITAGVITGGQTVTFIYDGTNYNIISIV